MPPVTSFLFAAVGILTFIGCPATILLLVHRTWQLNWKFFAFAGPVDAILYGAYGALLVHLAKEL